MGVLLLDVLVEHRPVVATVTLGGEVEGLPGVLGEGPHEALQGPVEVGGRIVGGVGRQAYIGVGVGPTGEVGGIVGADGGGQGNDVVRVGVHIARHGDAVGEAGLDGLVDVEHVAHVVPGVRVVVDGAIGVHATRAMLLEETNHGGGAGTWRQSDWGVTMGTTRVRGSRHLPPLIQTVKGASVGSWFRASKNQKKMCSFSATST